MMMMMMTMMTMMILTAPCKMHLGKLHPGHKKKGATWHQRDPSHLWLSDKLGKRAAKIGPRHNLDALGGSRRCNC
eukprot:12217640-Karenia_brevis.AAC.1